MNSASQSFVTQLASANESEKRVSEQELVVAAVEAERHLVKVSRQLLNAQVVVGSHNRSLEERPDALDSVGVDVGLHPLLHAVVDRPVLGVLVAGPPLRQPLVGDDGLSTLMRDLADEGRF